jgi:thioredoxin reductase
MEASRYYRRVADTFGQGMGEAGHRQPHLGGIDHGTVSDLGPVHHADGVECGQPPRAGELPADAVFLLTGYHPDWALLEAAGVQIDADRRVARYDPETLETSVPSLFLAGVVVSGRDVPPVFIENGRAHGEKIVRTLKERL